MANSLMLVILVLAALAAVLAGMSVFSGEVYGFDGALMSTASPQEWLDGVCVPAIGRQPNPQQP